MEVKQEWNDEDFDSMGWHDCRLYGLKLLDEKFDFSLDIDYIFDWIRIEDAYKFVVSPCVLTFHHVSNVEMNFKYGGNLLCFIGDIFRENRRISPNGKIYEWDYKIECDVGVLKFTCSGFEQKVMASPKLIDGQDLNRDFSVFMLDP